MRDSTRPWCTWLLGFISIVSTAGLLVSLWWTNKADAERSEVLLAIAGSKADQAQRMQVLEDKLKRLENELKQERQQHQLVSECLRRSTAGLGIQYQEDDNTKKVSWVGTGFLLKDYPYCATAAHVVQQLREAEADYARRGLRPRIVAQFCDCKTVMVLQSWTHARYLGSDADRQTVQIYDLGLLKTDRGDLADGLVFSTRLPSLAIGEEIATAGFPNKVDTIVYPTAPDKEILPTYRFGRVQRVCGDELAQYGKHALIQHDLPLVGGFSGAPIVDRKGELIGIATYSSFRFFHVKEMAKGRPAIGEGPARLLDAANVNFATNAGYLRDWLVAELAAKTALDR